jgi:YesN/AraC family two-component response regulator
VADPRLELVGEAVEGARAATLARLLRRDAMLLDMRMPGPGGLDASGGRGL